MGFPFHIIPILIISLGFLMMVVYGLSLWIHRDRSTPRTTASISVCVAARNEAANILDCLRHLAAQNYPPEKIEFLIGDDDSEDETGALILEFIRDKPQFRYFKITETSGHLKGKQNVLAKLFREAKGELLYVTDADIEVPPNWAAELAGAFDPGVGMVSGTTVVEAPGALARMQQLDWTFGMGLNEAHNGLGIPLTGSGNNMAMTREAYEAIGGYENIPFSITEDYKLFQVMCEKGPYEFRFLFRPEALARSKPVGEIKTLLRQRRRWFRGGQEIAWYNRALYLLNVLVMPSLIALLFLSPTQWFPVMYGLKIFGDLFLLLPALVRLKKLSWLKYFFFYELYYQITALVWPLVTPFGKKVVWKGREYTD